jgi:CRISPR-associated exonuclease Cas4
MPFSSDRISGTLVNYYLHCHRQAWLFNMGLHVEDLSDSVKKGKWIDRSTFTRKKEIEIAGEHIKADFIDENRSPVEVHEVKASKFPRKDHEFQMGFYLHKLREKGVDAVGIIHYPEINEIIKVNLDDIGTELNKVLEELVSEMNGNCPPRLSFKLCKGCAFSEFCYA